MTGQLVLPVVLTGGAPRTALLTFSESNVPSGSTVGSIGISASGGVSCGALSGSIVNGTLSGSVSCTANSVALSFVTITAPWLTTSQAVAVAAYGDLTATPANQTITLGTIGQTSSTITISQAVPQNSIFQSQIPNATIALTKSCQPGANVTLSTTGGTNSVPFTVTAVSAPSPALATGQHACTIAVSSSITGSTSLSIPVDISTTSLTITGKARQATQGPRSPGEPPSVPNVPLPGVPMPPVPGRPK